MHSILQKCLHGVFIMKKKLHKIFFSFFGASILSTFGGKSELFNHILLVHKVKKLVIYAIGWWNNLLSKHMLESFEATAKL